MLWYMSPKCLARNDFHEHGKVVFLRRTVLLEVEEYVCEENGLRSVRILSLLILRELAARLPGERIQVR